MKTKLILIAALLSTTFMLHAKSDKANKKSEKVEVTIEADGDKMVKKIIINGKQLSAEEIKEFEASGKMKTIHMDHGDMDGKNMKVIMMKGDGSNHGDMEKHVKIIKKHTGDHDGEMDEDIQVFIEKDGDKTTEKIIVNGKELSADEIEEFKASGKMKIIHLDSDMISLEGHEMMFFNSDTMDGDIDIEVIMDKIGDIQGLHEDSMVQEWISEDGKNIKIIKKGFIIADDSASLGFMANVEDDGWHLTKIMDKSGAKDVGIIVGDVVTRIGNVDLVRNPDSEKVEFSKLPKFEKGEIVEVQLNRAGKPITFNVQARMLDKSEMIIDLKIGNGENFEWIEKLHEGGDIASNIKVMVFDSKNGGFKLNEDDIHMVFPEKLGKMNFFISDGSSTSKLLGKHHEMSALSDDLGKYFNTKGGVLVLHVDESNAFALKDGDVIKSINGNKVKSPKDVVKHLIKAKDEKNIKLKVIRHKKGKTLKYRK